MTTPLVTVLYNNNVFYLPLRYAETPKDRLASTPGDNLAEFSGRIAYDSFYNVKGRPTAAYHEHILDTKHHSVYAHVVETFTVTCKEPQTRYEVLMSLQSRPGVWVTAYTDSGFRMAVSLRAVLEWLQHGPVPAESAGFSLRDRCHTLSFGIGRAIADLIRNDYPHAMARHSIDAGYITSLKISGVSVMRVAPMHPMEEWVSLYLDGVSRDLLQELVRHHYQTNPSVRSTRYVDEGNSTQIVHPALAASGGELGLHRTAASVFSACKDAYKEAFSKLTAAGVDNKTARGASRSLLPGATETRLVFSMSRAQAKHLLALRANEATGAVDPEIMQLAHEMRKVLRADPVQWDV